MEYSWISQPTPVTTSIITTDSGSTRMLTSTTKLPPESQRQPVETIERCESSRVSRSISASTESTNPARIESDATRVTRRLETLEPTAMLKERPSSGVSSTSQP